jgi:apolipoprotein N-acyltransferase
VLVNADRTTTNSVIVWNGAAGPGERHDKKIIQPFGEYLPMRGFFRLFSSYADRAGYFVPGNGSGAVRADPFERPASSRYADPFERPASSRYGDPFERPASSRYGDGIEIGVATCYEVAFDRAFRDSMHAGAQLLTVPTNNATFGDSEMTYQQLAMSRIRAVEHGRALVVAATSGVSAIIGADGEIQQETPKFVPAALVAQLPLRSSTTLATRIGPVPELLSVILTAAAVGVAAIRRRNSRGGKAADRNATLDQPVG